MKTYHINCNDYYRSATLVLCETPTILYFLTVFVQYVCSFFPSIPLPKLYYRSSSGPTTLRNWFGDTQQLFHCYVCTPLSSLLRQHTKFVSIDLPYKFAKERFPTEFKDFEFEWDEDDRKFIKKARKLDERSYHYFKEVYETLNVDYKRRSLNF